MKTSYYFVVSGGENTVMATDEKKYSFCFVDGRGIDITSGVDLYQYDVEDRLNKDLIVSQLKSAYQKVDGLYNMEDIERDYPDEVFDYSDFEKLLKDDENPDGFEIVAKIIEVDETIY